MQWSFLSFKVLTLHLSSEVFGFWLRLGSADSTFFFLSFCINACGLLHWEIQSGVSGFRSPLQFSRLSAYFKFLFWISCTDLLFVLESVRFLHAWGAESFSKKVAVFVSFDDDEELLGFVSILSILSACWAFSIRSCIFRQRECLFVLILYGVAILRHWMSYTYCQKRHLECMYVLESPDHWFCISEGRGVLYEGSTETGEHVLYHGHIVDPVEIDWHGSDLASSGCRKYH